MSQAAEPVSGLRGRVKHLAFLIACVMVAPLTLACVSERLARRGDRTFQGCSQLVALIPFSLGTYLRAAFHATSCTAVDREVAIGFLTLLSHRDTEIGRETYIGPQGNIGSCRIGEGCLLGSGVHVLSGKRQHGFDDATKPIREQCGMLEKVVIGDDCWIGNQATIMADVGSGSIVSAGAVIVQSVPPRSIVAGNPARVVRSR